VAAPTTNPTCNTNAGVIFRYSIIGNTLYLNYKFYQVSAGTSGSGVYLHIIPNIPGIEIDTTDISFSTTTSNTNYGTRFGSCSLSIYGSGSNAIGYVYMDSNNKLILWGEGGFGGGVSFNAHSSTYFQYSSALFKVSFDAMIPLLQ
jgi:hypothetical protein